MKKWIALFLIIVLSISLQARDNMNTDLNVKVLKLQEMAKAFESQKQNLPLYLSQDKRYFVNTIQTAEGDKSEVIFQEWNGSAWQNTARYEFSSGYDYIGMMLLFLGFQMIDVELITYLPELVLNLFTIMTDYLQLDYALYQVSEDGTTWINYSRFLLS